MSHALLIAKVEDEVSLLLPRFRSKLVAGATALLPPRAGRTSLLYASFLCNTNMDLHQRMTSSIIIPLN